jgi:hypothetical protein
MRTEPRYSKDMTKPRRGPKKPEKMKGGKLAQRRGKENQRQIADYVNGKNRHPLKGVDIIKGTFALEARTLDQNYPQMHENMLQEAEIHARKLNPNLIGASVVRKKGTKIADAVFSVRLKHAKEMMEAVDILNITLEVKD